jgi:hypothetical protein
MREGVGLESRDGVSVCGAEFGECPTLSAAEVELAEPLIPPSLHP